MFVFSCLTPLESEARGQPAHLVHYGGPAPGMAPGTLQTLKRHVQNKLVNKDILFPRGTVTTACLLMDWKEPTAQVRRAKDGAVPRAGQTRMRVWGSELHPVGDSGQVHEPAVVG